MKVIFFTVFALICITSHALTQKNKASYQVKSLKITTLSTMLANRGIGEWGYSALVEVDGKKILFDTGNRPETVLNNAKDLRIDLSDVEDVILSHNHGDHTGGLTTLRNAFKNKNSKALTTIHVGEGIFAKRKGRNNRMLALKTALEKEGVNFISYRDATEIYPGVWLTGTIKRIHPERNWSGRGRIETEQGDVEDNIPEDMALVISTEQGFVLISGCGHAGIINTMEHIITKIGPGKVSTAIGGFHLMNANDNHLAWTANKLKSFGVTQMIGAHCTGIDSLYTIRHLLHSDRKHMVVGSVGDSFSLEQGVQAGAIAR